MEQTEHEAMVRVDQAARDLFIALDPTGAGGSLAERLAALDRAFVVIDEALGIPAGGPPFRGAIWDREREAWTVRPRGSHRKSRRVARPSNGWRQVTH
jgi:hypothetical protein